MEGEKAAEKAPKPNTDNHDYELPSGDVSRRESRVNYDISLIV